MFVREAYNNGIQAPGILANPIATYNILAGQYSG